MDFKNIFCRLCAELQPDYNLLEITDDKAVNMNLANKIMQCYNVKITADDILPRHVCSNCCDKVTNAFEFHELVHKSQEFLMKQMNVDPNLMYIEVKQEKIDTDACTNDDLGLNDDNYGDDFPTDTKMENDSDNDNSEDEKPLFERKFTRNCTLKDSQNNLSSRRDYESESEDEFEIKETKKRKGQGKWKCVECNIFLSSHQKYCSHYLNVHKKAAEYPCPDCPKKYDKHESFLSHRRVHNGRFICKICTKSCYDDSSLKRHMYTHSSLTPYPCMECNKSFKTDKSLQRHQNIHLPEEVRKKKPKMYQCELCHKKFMKEANLKFHKENHDPGESPKIFVCDQCGNNFTRKAHLERHMSTHLNVFPFRCDKCPKAFKHEDNLNRHKQCHVEGEPFKCDVCLRPFRHKRALKRHAQIHTNLLPYECEYCHKCFREKSFLKIHLRQHTGERPYSCLECNHSFANDSNFIKHLKGRHGLQNVSVANQRVYPFIKKTEEQV